MFLKLTGFALALALIFGAAFAVGDAVGPVRDRSGGGDAHGAMETHGEMGAGDETHETGLRLALEQTALGRGRATQLRFEIVEPSGKPVTGFDVEHEKRMHLIVVRHDGAGFQHLHPRLSANGTWSVPLALPLPGAYRVFADFSHSGEAQTLGGNLTVDGDADYRPFPIAADAASAGSGYEVRLRSGDLRAGRESDLAFNITRGGEPVTTQDYLGAGGHLVALREDDLEYLHVHPVGGNETIRFMTEFPTEGRYRLYLQFKHAGRVHTAEFTREVSR